MKASDYIANQLVKNGITDVFCLVGGGAMHLDDSLAYCEGLNMYYFLHEQAAAIAAEGYARITGKMPAVLVTTGPGGVNALNGVLCAWQDDIPMLVLSGQVRRNMMVESTGLNLRQYGEQEHRIVETVKVMTKFAKIVNEPTMIGHDIDQAVDIAYEGRRGPCWLDIPLDIQGMDIDPADQIPYKAPDRSLTSEVDVAALRDALKSAKRPVIIVGSGVRTCGAYDEFLTFIDRAAAPILAARSNADLLPVTMPHYYGNFGSNGGRAGNFIVQNADLLLVLGCRLSSAQVGFNYDTFSPNSYKIMVDIDDGELHKPALKVDARIRLDLREFYELMAKEELSFESMDEGWIPYCEKAKERFPIYQEKFGHTDGVNPYFFAKIMNELMKDDAVGVVGNSCACVSIKQYGVRTTKQRLWGNINCGTMGYDLPAAIGACIAAKRPVMCIAGDGSIQMNIQELQTIVNYNLPVKIFVFNNNGYRSIVLSQTNNFKRLSGCTRESGLSLPKFEKLAMAYDIPYFRCERNEDLQQVMTEVLNSEGYAICEIIEDKDQAIEPKLGSRVLEDGSIVSPVLNDLSPFLPRDVYEEFANYEGCKS